MPRSFAVQAVVLAAALTTSLLAATSVAATSVEAAPRRALVLDEPTIAGSSARLQGRVATAARRVTLQSRHNGRWLKVRVVGVRHHRFRTSRSVPQTR